MMLWGWDGVDLLVSKIHTEVHGPLAEVIAVSKDQRAGLYSSVSAMVQGGARLPGFPLSVFLVRITSAPTL